MRTHLVDDLLYRLARDLQIDECGEPEAEYLEGLSLPTNLFVLLRHNWPTISGAVGPHTIYPVKEIVALCRDYPSLIKSSMLPIGGAPNGDPLVLRYAPDGAAEVGLICHDDFWGKYEDTPARAYVRVTPTLEEYLLRAAEDKYLPTDYYPARELQELQSEMNGRQT